jgi:voltage-gated potassium channel
MSAVSLSRRSLERFRSQPASIRYATLAIIGTTVAVVVVGAVLVRLFAHGEYETMGDALWFALQTVTTVGYGDVTPESTIGRIVGAVVMLTAIGLITVITAAITSTFVEAARRKAEHEQELLKTDEERTVERIEAAVGTIVSRLDRIEEALATGGGPAGRADSAPGPDR